MSLLSLFGRRLRGRRAGEESLVWHRAGFEAPERLKLTSADFADGEPMPVTSAGQGVGGNVSPELSWQGVPKGTKELVLVIEDADVPLKHPIVHAIARGIDPKRRSFAAGALSPKGESEAGPGTFGSLGYQGPRPIPGHGVHRYVFQLFAVDTAVVAPKNARPDVVLAQVAGHVLARGRLTGTYER